MYHLYEYFPENVDSNNDCKIFIKKGLNKYYYKVNHHLI